MQAKETKATQVEADKSSVLVGVHILAQIESECLGRVVMELRCGVLEYSHLGTRGEARPNKATGVCSHGYPLALNIFSS